MERIMFGHTDGSPYVITARNLENAWDIAIRTIWTSGTRRIDQRENHVREILNMVLHITGTTNDYPEKCPCGKNYGSDFAVGLVTTKSAITKAASFDYSYGERIRRNDALDNVIAMLRAAPSTRNAVLTIYQNSDTKTARDRAEGTGKLEVPCMVMGMMIIRDNKLHFDLIARSNDFLMAMPSDIFGFRSLQHYIAEEVGCDVGSYTQLIMNAHIIEENGLDFMTNYMKN